MVKGKAVIGILLMVGVISISINLFAESDVSQVINELIGKLGSYDAGTRFKAVQKLGSYANSYKYAMKDAVEPLCALLKDENRDIRIVAMQALERIKDPRAIEPLISMLNDEDPSIRGQAAFVLGRMRAVQATKPIIKLLKDDNEDVRMGACMALTGINDIRAVEPLALALNDQSQKVRKAAAGALVLIREPSALKYLIAVLEDEKSPGRIMARAALLELTGEDFGDNTVEWRKWLKQNKRFLKEMIAEKDPETDLMTQIKGAVKRLRFPHPEEREAGIYYLEKIARKHGGKIVLDHALEPLKDTLNDKSAKVRMKLVLLLRVLRKDDDRAVDLLISALRDKDASVKVNALASLSAVKDPGIIEPVMACLNDESENVVAEAMRTLEDFKDPRVIEPVLGALRRVSWHTHYIIIDLLTAVGEPAVEPLIAALKDDNEHVRAISATVLGNLKDKRAIGPLMALRGDKGVNVAPRAEEALEKIEYDKISGDLEARLSHENPNIRVKAVKALGDQRDSTAVKHLVVALSDKDRNVQKAAAGALGKIGDASAAVALVTALKDKKFLGKREAMLALGKMKDSEVVKMIVESLGGADELTQGWFLAVLREIGQPAKNALIGLLKDENYFIRITAVKELAIVINPNLKTPPKVKDQKTTDIIIDFIRDDPHIDKIGYNKKIYLLARLHDSKAARMMLESIKETKGEVDQTLRLTMLDIGYIAKGVLIEALNDENADIRRAAAYILGYYRGGPDIINPLIAAFDDEDEKVRKTAICSAGYSLKYSKKPELLHEAVQRFNAMLQDKSESTEIRIAAAEALHNVKDNSSIELLIGVVSDKTEPAALRIKAAGALQAVENPRVRKVLDRIRNDQSEDKELRQAAMPIEELYKMLLGEMGEKSKGANK